MAPKRKRAGPDLLGVLDNEKRVALIARGYFRVPDQHGGPPKWRRPGDGVVLSEAEAFAELEGRPCTR